MAKQEVWRDYVIRKYVRARSVLEAIELAESSPVIEVNEQKENPSPSNSSEAHAVGFASFDGA